MTEQVRLWTPGNDAPEWMLTCAQEVNDKYPNLSLSFIPREFQGPEDTRPCAIVEVDRDNNILGIIARFSWLEFYPANIFNWLLAHDTQKVDVWGALQHQIKREEKAREDSYTERNYELADMFASVARSNLHTYRINGHKVGAENTAPTIGLFDASGEDQQDS